MSEFDPEKFHTTPLGVPVVEPNADQREGAAAMFAVYTSYKMMGFTPEEAFALVQTILRESVRGSRGDRDDG